MIVHCKYDNLVSIKDLKLHPKNRNNHPEDQINRLAEILQYQGWRYPIKVSKLSGFVTSGHGRISAAKANGWKEVPVNFQDYESLEQEYADLTADNAIASWAELDLSGINTDIGDLGPDFNIDLLGIKNFTIDVTDKLEPGCDEDAVPEQVEPKTKRGDLYKLGNHRLLCGDSTSIDDVEKIMGGEKAEICFTSPPYADQRTYNGNSDLSTEHLVKIIRSSVSFCSYYVINLGLQRKDKCISPYWDAYIKEAESCDLKFLSWNIWHKPSGGSIGQMAAMFPIEHEWIFIFGKQSKELNCTIENKLAGTMRYGTNRGANGKLSQAIRKPVRSHRPLGTVYVGDFQRFIGEEHKHPAMFPVEFPATYIEAMTDECQLVYEPFGGSGSTLIACEKTNRKCFMIEIDPHYCDIIVSRWEKFSNKKVELLNG